MHQPWSPNVVALIGKDIYANMNCLEAWRVVPINSVVGMLDAVRNRILNFVLEIEAQAPEAGEAAMNSNPVPQEVVSQVFNTNIYGSVQNVATGSTDFQQHAINNDISPEVFKELAEAVETIKGSDTYDEAKTGIQEMEESYGTDSFKLKYQNFMSILSNHITVLAPVVAPYLPTLAALLSKTPT